MARLAEDQMTIDRLEMQAKNAQETADRRGEWLERAEATINGLETGTAKLEAQKADLLAALNRVMQKYETIYCDCVLREFPQSQPFDERPEVIEARAAIERAS